MAEKNEIEILVKAEVKKALSGMKSVSDQSKKMGADFNSTANIIKGALTGVVAGALAKAIEMGVKFLDVNEDLYNQFGTVGKQALKMRDELVTSFGLSLNEASKLLGETGRLAQSLGFTSEEALRLSGDISKLAVNLANSSTSGLTSSQAAEALTRSLSGQTRGLVQLGIPLSENEIKQAAYAKGLSDTALASDRAAKAQIIFELALKKSGQSLEAASFSSLSLAERMQRLGKFGENVVTIFGAQLATRLTGIVDSIGKFSQGADALNTVQIASRKVIESLKIFGTLVFAIPIGLTTGLTDIGNAVLHTGDIFKALSNVVKRAFTGDIGGAFDELKKKISESFQASLTGSVITSTLNDAKSLFTDFTVGTTLDVQSENQKKLDSIKSTNAQIVLSEKDRQSAVDQIRKFATTDKFAQEQQALDAEYQQAIANAEKIGTDKNAIEEAYALKSADIRKREQEAKDQAARDDIQRAITTASAIGGAAQAVSDFIGQIVANEVNGEIAKNKELEESKRKAIEADYTAGKINAEKKKELLAQVDDEEKAFENEKKKRLKDAAVAQKAIAIFNSIINTASAVVAALATPFIGPALAIAAGVTGAAQTALISAQPLPEFAEGGLVTGPFPAMVGHGTEAILPAELTRLLMEAAGAGGSSSTTNNDTKNITLNAYGIQDPTAFINKAQRQLGNNVFGGAR